MVERDPNDGDKTNVRVVSDAIPKDDYSDEYQVTWPIFVYWILPVLIISMFTRFVCDPEAASGLRFGQVDEHNDISTKTSTASSATSPSIMPTVSPSPQRPKRKPTPVPTMVENKPTQYIDVVQKIKRRRLDWDSTDSSSMLVKKDESTKSSSFENASKSQGQQRGPSTDPTRAALLDKIETLRTNHANDPTNLLKIIDLADALRLFDVQYHDGGSMQEEAISTYKNAISLAVHERKTKISNGEETNRSLSGTVNIPEEITLDYSARSIDGILCALHTSLGKVYFMANMFERAVQSYTNALDIEPYYLDATSSRGSARIILGKFEDAGKDFTKVVENDKEKRFLDVYTGLGRILQANESAVPSGWEPIIERLNYMIPALESQYEKMSASGGKNMIANTLNRLLHVLFVYHDVKTKDTEQAWQSISKSFKYKMSALPEWNAGFEKQKIAATKQIFREGFWPENVGSKTSVPIFIVGFVRSGSTLLERILDAHPQIEGFGENSIFNGMLDSIRNKIVETSLKGDSNEMASVISTLADNVIDEMHNRWKMLTSLKEETAVNPKRYVDKMLTNYYNIGFIHMLFPRAMILHVVREPLDTLWSAYKHEFPAGTLDYTSDFSSLVDLYDGYRNLMDHWDKELPGRVTHVKYEDIVHDMPGVARKIIAAASLEWDDSLLEFHKIKKGVNTLSTTQVRKGVYKHSLQAWKKYESYLSPLIKLLGDKVAYDINTSLPGYSPPDNVNDEMVSTDEL